MNKWQFNSAAILALVVGLAVGGVIGFAWGKRSSATDQIKPDAAALGLLENEAVLPGNLAAVSNSVSAGAADRLAVADQAAGTSVIAGDIELTQVSWLAVRESRAGEWGNILGAKRLPAGRHAEETIALLRPTIAGQNYFVVVYRDNGDLAFDHKTDTVLEVSGQPVSVGFIVK